MGYRGRSRWCDRAARLRRAWRDRRGGVSGWCKAGATVRHASYRLTVARPLTLGCGAVLGCEPPRIPIHGSAAERRRMGWFSRKVAVTLIDDATGAPFATTEMPPGDLPESFEVETTLHLGDSDWTVVHAEPRTRPEYTKSGRLVLRLRRIEQVNLNDILFSLPSICDRIPAVGDRPLAGDECVLVEDDWRQFEFVSRQLAAESDAEIAAIRRIHEQECASVGWRKLHVRRRPDPPIISPLKRDRLDQSFGGLSFRGVSFRGAGSPIVSGFSFRAADGLECYGVEEEGRVTVLGVVQGVPVPPPVRSADALAQIAREFDLDLVHWCRCGRASPDTPLFRNLLLGTDAEPASNVTSAKPSAAADRGEVT